MVHEFNNLSLKSDLHQIFPCRISTLIKREGNKNQGHDHQIEIIAMIFNKFSQLVLSENVWILVRRFCVLTLRLKGLICNGSVYLYCAAAMLSPWRRKTLFLYV